MRNDGNIGRRKLPHDQAPQHASATGRESYFITISCVPRGTNQLAVGNVWSAIEETIQVREKAGNWKVSLFLAMPDHCHALIAFPGKKRMSQVIGQFKAWICKSQGIRWQSGFFDHRLRAWESAVEKRKYILNNPVRAGFTKSSRDWPYQLDRLRR